MYLLMSGPPALTAIDDPEGLDPRRTSYTHLDVEVPAATVHPYDMHCP